jgi:hexokinase
VSITELNASQFLILPTYSGAIYDTGTNGAYVEETSNVASLGSATSQAKMVLNTEWGSLTSKVDIISDISFIRPLI